MNDIQRAVEDLADVEAGAFILMDKIAVTRIGDPKLKRLEDELLPELTRRQALIEQIEAMPPTSARDALALALVALDHVAYDTEQGEYSQSAPGARAARAVVDYLAELAGIQAKDLGICHEALRLYRAPPDIDDAPPAVTTETSGRLVRLPTGHILDLAQVVAAGTEQGLFLAPDGRTCPACLVVETAGGFRYRAPCASVAEAERLAQRLAPSTSQAAETGEHVNEQRSRGAARPATGGEPDDVRAALGQWARAADVYGGMSPGDKWVDAAAAANEAASTHVRDIAVRVAARDEPSVDDLIVLGRLIASNWGRPSSWMRYPESAMFQDLLAERFVRVTLDLVAAGELVAPQNVQAVADELRATFLDGPGFETELAGFDRAVARRMGQPSPQPSAAAA